MPGRAPGRGGSIYVRLSKPIARLTVSCSRDDRRPSAARPAPAGYARVRLLGRGGAPRLSAGRYRVTVRAVDRDGRHAAARTVTLKVAARRASARQREAERAAAALGRLDPDPPAVGLDDAPPHGQADAVPVACRRERANIPKIRSASSGATPTPWSRTRDDPVAVAPRSASTVDRAAAPSPRNFDRVADEVLQDAAQQARVAADLGQVADLERRPRLGQPRRAGPARRRP